MVDEATFPFRIAALASGVPRDTIRNWINKSQVYFNADESHRANKWRRFTTFDCIKLAVIQRLVSFGMSAEAADTYAMGAFSPGHVIAVLRNPERLLKAIAHTQIWAWRTGTGWDGCYTRSLAAAPNKRVPDAWITVDVGEVAGTVTQRLEEATRLGIDDD